MNLLYKTILLTILPLLLFFGCGDSNSTRDITIFEDAEYGLSENWHTIKGDSYPSRISAQNGSNYAVHLPVSWYEEDGLWYNPHEYHLTLNSSNKNILEVDIGGTGRDIPHYVIGVQISTSYGMRTILWNSWYNHQGYDPKYNYDNTTMVFPSPVELVRGFGYEDNSKWSHFSADIEKALHYFEEDNTLLSVDTFVATGGDLDNIGLSSY
jgi:uncharacterized protein YcfL